MAYLLAVAVLSAAAAANPTLELARDRFRYVFVFDITHSMYVEDRVLNGSPTHRLALAKAAVRQSLSELPCGSDVSMAVFTEHRSFILFTPVEVCRHLADLNTTLDSIDWRMAWAMRSEVSKALFASLRTAPELGPHTRVVFLSDGHEAPPLHERFRPRYRAAATPAAGLVVGVGGDTPRPIPKPGTDGEVYAHAEVAQVDGYRLGRTSATVVEPLVGVDSSDVDARIAAGTEHLSRLRESHLMALAGETALDYLPLEAPGDLTPALTRPDLAYRERGPVALGWLFGLAALVSAVLAHLPGIRRERHG
jgi:mxaL protein